MIECYLYFQIPVGLVVKITATAIAYMAAVAHAALRVPASVIVVPTTRPFAQVNNHHSPHYLIYRHYCYIALAF